MVGGRPEDLERARPVLEKLTGGIAYMGLNGAGYAMKLPPISDWAATWRPSRNRSRSV